MKVERGGVCVGIGGRGVAFHLRGKFALRNGRTRGEQSRERRAKMEMEIGIRRTL